MSGWPAAVRDVAVGLAANGYEAARGLRCVRQPLRREARAGRTRTLEFGHVPRCLASRGIEGIERGRYENVLCENG